MEIDIDKDLEGIIKDLNYWKDMQKKSAINVERLYAVVLYLESKKEELKKKEETKKKKEE